MKTELLALLYNCITLNECLSTQVIYIACLMQVRREGKGGGYPELMEGPELLVNVKILCLSCMNDTYHNFLPGPWLSVGLHPCEILWLAAIFVTRFVLCLIMMLQGQLFMTPITLIDSILSRNSARPWASACSDVIV